MQLSDSTHENQEQRLYNVASLQLLEPKSSLKADEQGQAIAGHSLSSLSLPLHHLPKEKILNSVPIKSETERRY